MLTQSSGWEKLLPVPRPVWGLGWGRTCKTADPKHLWRATPSPNQVWLSCRLPTPRAHLTSLPTLLQGQERELQQHAEPFGSPSSFPVAPHLPPLQEVRGTQARHQHRHCKTPRGVSRNGGCPGMSTGGI